ncbi:hypothetical protein OB955_16625 [Halobacteria archaeon AArc-m2/3/4]|uniref:Uncharacterized protein n=1 Tax=Natronoglomus mannanivorans TaxID=2979990 RepID=A0ABT2QHE2_9EURY|nr:hypothetical protein [Halobacteria archaeon AArc-m2/3/4]
MKVSIPGLPGVYYDTNAESTAISATMTLAGRRAPKPYGYAAQLLPILWSFDVDLREVPSDHPFQYLHPEGAHSFDELARDDRLAELGRELDFALQFANSVNEETEAAVSKLVGREDGGDSEAIVIEVQAGDGEVVDLERERERTHEHEFDIEDDPEPEPEPDPSPGLDTTTDREDDEFERTDDPFDGSASTGDHEDEDDTDTFDADRDR